MDGMDGYPILLWHQEHRSRAMLTISIKLCIIESQKLKKTKISYKKMSRLTDIWGRSCGRGDIWEWRHPGKKQTRRHTNWASVVRNKYNTNTSQYNANTKSKRSWATSCHKTVVRLLEPSMVCSNSHMLPNCVPCSIFEDLGSVIKNTKN